MNYAKFIWGALIVSGLFAISCNKKSDDVAAGGTTSFSAEKPSGIMTSISSAVAAAGSSLGSPSASSAGSVNQLLSEASCDSHGQPISSINQSNGAYPGTLTYCKLKINDGSPDTVQGGFTLPKNISCALEKQGITFDGVAKSVTIPVDTTCFTQNQIDDIGSSITATVTATKPAAFNSYFDAGIVLVVDGFGTFKIASKVSGTKGEFLTYEDQGTTKRGSTYGSLDSVTGELRYEARMERVDCTESGSCGWNRHIKLYADMTSPNGTPDEIESLSFGYSNIQNSPGQSGPGGELVTATGNLSTGIKPRFWYASNGTPGTPASTFAHVQDYSKWVETSNSACYTSASDAATTCGTGIAGMTSSVAFLLTGGSYTPVGTWHTSFAGATFTAVDVNAD